MKQIIVLLIALAGPVLAGDVLQFSLADRTPHDGWLTNNLNGATIWINPSPELTAKHVASAELEWRKAALPADMIERLKKMAPNATIKTNDHPCVWVTFTEEGRTILAQVTAKHKGELLAILSKDKVISAPKIMEPITAGKAQIAGILTVAEAEALVDTLNPRPAANQPSERTR